MRRVLIIEDDADQREILALFVKELGWEVLETSDGESGIQMAASTIPQVVFCDLLMQGMNGFQVCRALRQNASLQCTHIVVTSGRVFDADRTAALEAGANDYLQKPLDLDRIRQTLENIHERDSALHTPTDMEFSKAAEGNTTVRFWGVRGSIPTPGPGTVRYGGNTSCVEVRAGGQIIILDAGTGLRPLGQELVQEFKDLPMRLNLLLSHTHWDHIQGLPYFAPLYRMGSHLRILGYEGARSSLSTVLSSQMESPFFPVGLQDVPSRFEIEELRAMRFDIEGVRVDAWFANHPGICVGYRLSHAGNTIAFFPDNEPPSRQQKVRAAAGLPQERSATYAAGEEERLIEFIRGVDILIMDSQYTHEEYERHVGWGHGCIDDVVRLATQAKVRQLLLFHHDPDHDDETIDRMQEHARELARASGSSTEVAAAYEGLQVELEKPA